VPWGGKLVAQSWPCGEAAEIPNGWNNRIHVQPP
jgi:hypothetical protein